MHTCDKRRSKSYIHDMYGASFNIERDFTNEDELWTPDVRESDAHVQSRANDVLNGIFNNDESTCA